MLDIARIFAIPPRRQYRRPTQGPEAGCRTKSPTEPQSSELPAPGEDAREVARSIRTAATAANPPITTPDANAIVVGDPSRTTWDDPGPCTACMCPVFWQALDGGMHCEDCEPQPPGTRRFSLVLVDGRVEWTDWDLELASYQNRWSANGDKAEQGLGQCEQTEAYPPDLNWGSDGDE